MNLINNPSKIRYSPLSLLTYQQQLNDLVIKVFWTSTGDFGTVIDCCGERTTYYGTRYRIHTRYGDNKHDEIWRLNLDANIKYTNAFNLERKEMRGGGVHKNKYISYWYSAGGGRWNGGRTWSITNYHTQEKQIRTFEFWETYLPQFISLTAIKTVG